MTNHAHAWQPVPLETARYRCSCGATAWRSRTGVLREHKQQHEHAAKLTARGRTTEHGGRVAPLPSLEQTERRVR